MKIAMRVVRWPSVTPGSAGPTTNRQGWGHGRLLRAVFSNVTFCEPRTTHSFAKGGGVSVASGDELADQPVRRVCYVDRPARVRCGAVWA